MLKRKRFCLFFSQCFFPQNLVANIKTPFFLLNAAYDAWQVISVPNIVKLFHSYSWDNPLNSWFFRSSIPQFQESLVPTSADPHGEWKACKFDRSNCNSTQIQFLQGSSSFIFFLSFHVPCNIYNVGIHNDLLLFFLLYETDFRMQMLDDIKPLTRSDQNGLFINSCFAHCQTEKQDTWYANDSPLLGNKVCH